MNMHDSMVHRIGSVRNKGVGLERTNEVYRNAFHWSCSVFLRANIQTGKQRVRVRAGAFAGVSA